MKNGAYIISEAERLNKENKKYLDDLILGMVKPLIKKLESKLHNHTIILRRCSLRLSHKKTGKCFSINGPWDVTNNMVLHRSGLFHKIAEVLKSLFELEAKFYNNEFNYLTPDYNPEAERIAEEAKRKEADQKRYEREFKSMRPVPVELLKKMTAQRILAYYQKKWRGYIVRLGYEMEMYNRTENPFILNYIKTLKEIMKTKPHVPRKKRIVKKKITKKK